MPTKRINISLPEDLYQQLQTERKQHGQSISKILQNAYRNSYYTQQYSRNYYIEFVKRTFSTITTLLNYRLINLNPLTNPLLIKFIDTVTDDFSASDANTVKISQFNTKKAPLLNQIDFTNPKVWQSFINFVKRQNKDDEPFAAGLTKEDYLAELQQIQRNFSNFINENSKLNPKEYINNGLENYLYSQLKTHIKLYFSVSGILNDYLLPSNQKYKELTDYFTGWQFVKIMTKWHQGYSLLNEIQSGFIFNNIATNFQKFLCENPNDIEQLINEYAQTNHKNIINALKPIVTEALCRESLINKINQLQNLLEPIRNHLVTEQDLREKVILANRCQNKMFKEFLEQNHVNKQLITCLCDFVECYSSTASMDVFVTDTSKQDKINQLLNMLNKFLQHLLKIKQNSKASKRSINQIREQIKLTTEAISKLTN